MPASGSTMRCTSSTGPASSSSRRTGPRRSRCTRPPRVCSGLRWRSATPGMPLMASHTVLVMTSAEKLGPGRSRTPPLPSLRGASIPPSRRRAAARLAPLFATVRGAPLYSLRTNGARPCVPACPERRSRRSSRAHDITIYRADWVLPVAAPVLADGGLAVSGERIVGVGPAPDLDGRASRGARWSTSAAP